MAALVGSCNDVELSAVEVVTVLCALKDSSSYGQKIYLHHSTCGLFLHYRWTDLKNKEHIEAVQ